MTETRGPVLAASGYSAFALEPFPAVGPGDDLADAILGGARATGTVLADGDIVVVASKAVFVAEKRYVDLAGVTPTPEAVDVAARTGRPAAVVQLILDNSTGYFLASWARPGHRLAADERRDRPRRRGRHLAPARRPGCLRRAPA